VNEVARALRAFTRIAVPLDGRRAAAVAVAISDSEDGPAFWLTRRASRLRGHGGQFALPGGRLDRGEDAMAAALRELREEIGATAGWEQCLGLLDDYPTRSGYVITPVVVKLSDGQRMTPNPAEVAELYRISFSELDVPPCSAPFPSPTARSSRSRWPGQGAADGQVDPVDGRDGNPDGQRDVPGVMCGAEVAGRDHAEPQGG
jgi:8-oxo-dGTP pyrophosphatase MutT (NUDIX family)